MLTINRIIKTDNNINNYDNNNINPYTILYFFVYTLLSDISQPLSIFNK